MSICPIWSGRFLVKTSRMTLSLIQFVHAQIFKCKYALARFTFTGLALGVSGKTKEETIVRKVHTSPSPHAMSVLQDAAPRAFGTCILNANGNLDMYNLCVSSISSLDWDILQKACIYMHCINSFCEYESNFVV